MSDQCENCQCKTETNATELCWGLFDNTHTTIKTCKCGGNCQNDNCSCGKSSDQSSFTKFKIFFKNIFKKVKTS